MSTQDKLAQAVPEGWNLRRTPGKAEIGITAPEGGPGGLFVSQSDRDLARRVLYALCESMLAAAPQPEAVQRAPIGYLCRHRSQVFDAISAFGPDKDLGYLWKYTHGTADLDLMERCEHLDVVRVYPAAAPQPEARAKPAAIVREDMGRKWAELSQDLPPGTPLYAAPQPEAVQVADEFDQIVEQLAEVSCPRCLGTQTIPAMSDNGPDAYEVEVCCDHCEGSGTAKGAYEVLAKFKQRASTELTQLRYFHWHTKEQEKKAAALAAQQAEREPLTDEQINDLLPSAYVGDAYVGYSRTDLCRLARAIERAHGIGKDQA